MPPWEGLVVGRDAVVADWTANGFPEMTGLRAVPTSVNRQPAVAYYRWDDERAAHLPLTIDVLRVSGDEVTEVTIFGAERFDSLGLPASLPADGGAR
jgi:RNA polymerase sigma-70 factor (ECF subfamily)